MFKLVVLFALVAVAVSKPHVAVETHLINAAPVAYTAPIVATYAAIPSATSYQSRTDIVSKPVVATFEHHVAAPVQVKTAEIIAPVVDTHVVEAAPVVVDTPVAAPVVATATSYQSRTDVVNKPVVAYTAHTAPVVAAYAYTAPVVKTVAPVAKAFNYVAPAYAYSAPAYAYSAPAYAYSAPAYGYSAPGYAYSAPAYGYGYNYAPSTYSTYAKW